MNTMYDGTSWTNNWSKSGVENDQISIAGSQAAAVVFATQSPISGATEEFTLGAITAV